MIQHKSIQAGSLVLVLLCGCVVAVSFAAVPASRPYASPDIHPDHTVTFRLLAPPIC